MGFYQCTLQMLFYDKQHVTEVELDTDHLLILSVNIIYSRGNLIKEI